VAILVELAAHLLENPALLHGPIRLLFTCDEEIGRGTDKIDLRKLNALVGYTIDGGAAGQLDVETFSADAATIQFTGRNIHPAIAKDRMVNAVRAAAFFIDQLPRVELAPECTADREPFLHPYGLEGNVAQAKISLLLRTFDTPELDILANRLRDIARQTEIEFPGLECSVHIKPQYRNLKDGLLQLPQSIELAKRAFANLGRACEETIIRGGTDGSLLTAKGLPTPNLSSGQHSIHALTEFACLDEMVESLEHLVELARLWSDQARF
jgi:tripeptide aminopeptidase